MNVTFGDKQQFAIDYEINRIQPYIMGNIRIWIGGIAVGYFEEEVMLSTAQYTLNHMSKNLNVLPNSVGQFVQRSKAQLFRFIGSLPSNGQFIMNLDESFDDFLMYAFKNEDRVQFLWNLTRAYHKYPDHPRGVQSALVDAEYFLKVVQEGDLFLRNSQETIG